MIPGNLPFEYPFRWRNDDLAAGVGVSPEIASILEQRDRDLEDFLAGGGGKPYATIVIAASDSTAADKASADFVCDGVADNVEIQAAFDAIDTNAGMVGGKVLLLEGTFSIAAGVEVNGRRASLEGMGHGTILDASGSFDAGVKGSTVIHMPGLWTGIKNLEIIGGTGLRCVFFRNKYDNYALGLSVLGGAEGISHDGPGGGALIVGNFVRSQTTAGIVLGVNGDERWVVAHNSVEGAQAGIVCNAGRGIIQSNVVWASTTDGITLNGDNNLCTGNVCDTNGAYGIKVGATATNARVAGNFLRNNTTAPLIDSGTGSQLSWPAHATYGDNFS